ncbi:hypothetical protein Golax_021501 [Gossypium laxum]|uniref:Uncharacterized protein n=1 Tax=Gossypium laxum TaxID=34288 RepID=A0A7J9AN47_9ROSI|nr:hypothetical protein [Gossypium laxum]
MEKYFLESQGRPLIEEQKLKPQ